MTRRTKREIWTHIYEQVLQKNALSILFVSLITRPLFFSVVTVCFTSLFLRCYTVHYLHSLLFLKFHFIFFLCLSLYSHTSRKFAMIYRVISLRSVHPFCPLFLAYTRNLERIISLFFSFPFISKYKFCVMLYYKYLKMKTIKIVYSLCFCFNLGKDMNSLPGSKTQPHCKYYTRKENFRIKILENAL